MVIFNREREKEELSLIIEENEYIFVYGESGVGKSVLINTILREKYDDFLSFSFKEAENDEFFNFINIIYEILNNKYNIKEIEAISKNFGMIKLKKIIEGNEIVKKLKKSFGINQKILLNEKYSEFFINFWKLLEKKGVNVIWLSNIEFVKKEEKEFIKGLLFAKENNIKIIFEKGNLIDNDIDKVLKDIISKRKIGEYHLLPFDKDHTRGFCKFLKKNFVEKIYDFSNGIPLKIEFEDSIKRIVDKKYNENEEKFLALLVIFFEFIDDWSYIIRILTKLGIENTKLDEKFDFLESYNNKIKIKHYYIYNLLKNKLAFQIIMLTEQLEFMKKNRKKTYFQILAKFNPNKLLEDEIEEFIDLLAEEIENFNILELKKFISFNIDSENNSIVFEILRLIKLQINIYFFDESEVEFSTFSNDLINLIAFIIKLQFLYHQDKFKEVIFLIENEFRNYFSTISTKVDEIFLDYINTTLTALKGASLLAIGNYTEAKNLLINAINILENKNIYKNLNDYLLNLLPAIEFENALRNEKFVNFNKIKNIYIKLKRKHNILALKLYDYQYINSNKEVVEYQLKELINEFENIGSVEKSYTLNNLLAFYIVTNNLKKAQEIIDTIEYKYFERYDKISLYNNAIIYFILKENYSKAKEYSEKALKIIEKEKFNDPSFITKVYLNTALLHKILDKNYTTFLEHINKILPKDYDDFYLLQEKIKFLKENKINSFEFKKDANDILEKFIFWPQIIHFWDFDIPLLNKDIINYLLKKHQ